MNATMNTSGKHDFHSDAESLSAFAEQALGERERGQVLAHLAVCGRCRQVVALAHEARLAAAEEKQLAAAKREAIQPFAWWRSWRFVWVPATVAAAFAVALFSVNLRHEEQNAQLARNERQEVTQTVATPEAPAQQEQAQAAPPAVAPKAAKSPVRSFKRASEGTAPNSPSREHVGTAAMPTPFPDEAGGIEHREGARSEAAPFSATAAPGFTGEGPAASPTTAAYTPEPPVDAWQQEQERKAATATAQRRLYAARAPTPASVHGADGGAAGSSTGHVTVSSPQVEKQAQPAPSPVAPTPSGTLVNPDGAAKKIYLPSGLRVESMASAGPRMLAIDTAGALFLSEDSGVTWEHVTPQWTGRAVKVRRQTAGSGVEAVPTKFFELLNDQSQIWLSTDGKTWIVK